jgi:hypothetical protein
MTKFSFFWGVAKTPVRHYYSNELDQKSSIALDLVVFLIASLQSPTSGNEGSNRWLCFGKAL